ncbi:cell division protein FtsA [Candidatus Roizmanbacteria bacterium RIFCSPHIGHO2_02_FULL_37_15]|uniref:Cell division protein FtsA n=1 Tax=Candidatus Roizmanbacteria bacterium RIFCSPLOWO2_01_FULL_37_16 TaxID=1802058 RepID=A0A1F7IIW4_9BACT|nr:MAG: cell division protein FtsA [Candidatus Roizmanbacteria bacterium RIFCSPHIGHO2_01_FULL_37_16b]OGK20426.1 MAG: cell division protein FtsA [Candidatus Roizmanbacteria bacterium RIFCSPHIGHO2_02_FULL_37_15]OGK34027.1 MAG: cell division protein FtsA [Candidatus Roizmanbacteria bacterium RIFCSPHIGHO2_12_FULL_36_11]OGK43277.1 MAG: cell division protein FtsA [Candidatus Roizmanbacteria bacterium RIFCSPLOWO2_01_FULL_37_16]OGK57678.1 MAG: cell division protein FtsA [Candidatus Roizmanbacteria bact
MSDKIIAAVDIGSYKVATVVGVSSSESNELRIIGFHSSPSRGVKKGLIVDIDEITMAVEESVEKTERMAGHKINQVFISVGGPHISSINSHGVVAISNPQSEIIEDDVNRAIEAARAISISNTRQVIEVIPREYVVDGQAGIKNPIGMTGVRLEVDTHIITASLTNLKNLNRSLSELGLNNSGYIFAGLASAEAVLTETEKELGVVLVDIGGGKTDICLFVEGALSYSSSIPVGAKHITNDIAVGLRVSLQSAEKIKLHLSHHFSNKKEPGKKDAELNLISLHLPENVSSVTLKSLTDGIIAPRLEEIYKLVSDEIEKSGFSNSVPSGLVITGGGAMTVGMIEIGRRFMEMPIRIGVPAEITGLVDEILNPQFSTTVGLLLYGQKNIIPEVGWKNFNKILRDVSLGNSINKIKEFFKQFIP